MSTEVKTLELLQPLTLYRITLDDGSRFEAVFCGNFSHGCERYADLLITAPLEVISFWPVPHREIRSACELPQKTVSGELAADDLQLKAGYWVQSSSGRHRGTFRGLDVYQGNLLAEFEITASVLQPNWVGAYLSFDCRESRFWEAPQ